MILQAEPGGLVVGGDMLGARHRRQRRVRLLAELTRVRCSEQRQRSARQPPHLPQGLSPVEPERTEGVRVGEQAERAEREEAGEPA